MAKILLPMISIVLLLGIAWINSIAMSEYLYWKYPWLDLPMHFLGGFWVSITALWVTYYVKPFSTYFIFELRTILYLSLFVVLFIGLMWELFEIRYGVFLAFEDNFRIGDMLSDIVMDVSGAIAAAFSVFFISRHAKSKS